MVFCDLSRAVLRLYRSVDTVLRAVAGEAGRHRGHVTRAGAGECVHARLWPPR